LTNAGFSIDTELEGMYKPYAADKKAQNWNVVKEGGNGPPSQRIAELELNKQILENKAKSSEIALITIGAEVRMQTEMWKTISI
jgi:beta-glucosidase